MMKAGFQSKAAFVFFILLSKRFNNWQILQKCFRISKNHEKKAKRAKIREINNTITAGISN